MEDSSSTLPVVAKGDECRVQSVETEKPVVAKSDCWLLNVGDKI